MREIPAQSVDMILCDPPYGTTRNAWDSIIPFGDLWGHYKRILSINGVVALTSQGMFTAKVMLSCESMFRYKLAWIKSIATNFLNAKKQPLRKHEDVCIFYGKQPEYTPQMSLGKPYVTRRGKRGGTRSYGAYGAVQTQSDGSRYPTDVIYFSMTASDERGGHPTQKPVALMEYLIRTYTREGATVLDNCMGSGTTGVACANTGRRFTGIEKDAGYFETASARIEAAYGHKEAA